MFNPSLAGIGRALSTGYCRLCHGKFSSRSLRNAFGKVPVMGENSEKQRRVDQVFFTDFQRLVGVAVRQDPALPQFVCKKCHAQFYKCRSVLRTFIQRVNASPTGHVKSKGKYVEFLPFRELLGVLNCCLLARGPSVTPETPLCCSGFCRSGAAQAQPGAEGGASCLGECLLPQLFPLLSVIPSVKGWVLWVSRNNQPAGWFLHPSAPLWLVMVPPLPSPGGSSLAPASPSRVQVHVGGSKSGLRWQCQVCSSCCQTLGAIGNMLSAVKYTFGCKIKAIGS